jgi:hypothetical protein
MNHPVNFKRVVDDFVAGFGLGFLQVILLIGFGAHGENALGFEFLDFGLLEVEGFLHEANAGFRHFVGPRDDFLEVGRIDSLQVLEFVADFQGQEGNHQEKWIAKREHLRFAVVPLRLLPRFGHAP